MFIHEVNQDTAKGGQQSQQIEVLDQSLAVPTFTSNLNRFIVFYSMKSMAVSIDSIPSLENDCFDKPSCWRKTGCLV